MNFRQIIVLLLPAAFAAFSIAPTGLADIREDIQYLKRYERLAERGSKAQKTALEDIKNGLELCRNEETIDNGIKEFTKAIAADPKCDVAYLERAFYLAFKEHYSAAVADLSVAIKLNPHDGLALNRRGRLYLALNQRDKALKDLSQAIDIEPRISILVQRGQAYQSLGRNAEAIKDYSQAIAKQGDIGQALSTRGKLYEKMGDFSKAAADYSLMVRRGEGDEDTFYRLGECNMKLQKFDAAVRDYTEAMKISPTSRDFVLPARAKAYEKLGRKDLAEADRKKANQ